MASKKVEFHEDAALEYEAAVDWYLERSLLVASKFVDAMDRAIDRSLRRPTAGPRAVAALVDSFFNGFRSQSSIANSRLQFRCWQSPTPVANPVIGNNASELERATLNLATNGCYNDSRPSRTESWG